MKKKCSRCHARLEAGARTCPYCGTMVRKPRGNVRMAPSVGVDGLLDRIRLPALTGKHLLAALGVIVTVLIFVLLLTCDSCSGCGSCSAGESCSSCSSCSSCASCGGEEEKLLANGAGYHCEYHYNSTLYYVDGDRLIALEDGMESGRVAVAGRGIECVYVDDNYIYYIIDGRIFRAPVNTYAVSDGDAPVGSVHLDPVDVGLERINGFALSGEDELCYWGQTADGGKVICVIDRDRPGEPRMVHSGKYSNVQCCGDSVYFASGEENTAGYIVRVNLETGSRATVFGEKADYYTFSGGRLIVCVLDRDENGSALDTSVLYFYDIETGKQLPGFDEFVRINGMVANDQWIYYRVEDTDAGQTLVYRFSANGKNHQLVFRKLGSYNLYGVAGSYFTLFGDDVYYICNYDQAPGSIVLTEHTVLDK